MCKATKEHLMTHIKEVSVACENIDWERIRMQKLQTLAVDSSMSQQWTDIFLNLN